MGRDKDRRALRLWHTFPSVRNSRVASHTTMSRPSRQPRPHYASTPSSEFIQAPRYTSSRSAYPTFLSLQETAWLQLSCAARGLVDAFRWDTVARLVARCVVCAAEARCIVFIMIPLMFSDSEVRANVFKSLILNTVSLVSIYFFDWLLLPLAQSQQKWFHRNLGWFYQVLWLLPVVGVSFYLNVSIVFHVSSHFRSCPACNMMHSI